VLLTTLFGDYAFDAGIVTVSFKSQGQGLLVTPLDPQAHLFKGKIHQKVYRNTTFGGCGSFSARVILPIRGKEVERYKVLLKQEYTCFKGIIALCFFR
jgi:hypothetical protein